MTWKNISQSDSVAREAILTAHRAFTHSNEYCRPNTCKIMLQSHSTNHKKCYGSWCEPTREVVLNNFHNARLHARFCNPEICPIMAAHEQGNHEGCFHE